MNYTVILSKRYWKNVSTNQNTPYKQIIAYTIGSTIRSSIAVNQLLPSLRCKSTMGHRQVHRSGINHRNETGLRKCYRVHPLKHSSPCLSKFIARDPANRDERPDHRVSRNTSILVEKTREKEREREIPSKDGMEVKEIQWV